MTRLSKLENRATRTILSALALITFGIHPVAGQRAAIRVQCGPELTESGGICVGIVARSDSVQQFNVELQLLGSRSGISGIPVVFKADSGTMLRDSVVTDSFGIARAIWYRPRGVGPAGIAADVRTASGSILKYIQLRPRETRLALRTAQDASINNFPGGSGRSLVVEILEMTGTSRLAISDTAQCVRHRVVFIPEGTGARVTPDTALGEVYDAKPRGASGTPQPGCFATARLAMGSEVGLHEIRTSGVPSPGYRIVENARLHVVNVRHLPQIIVAGVASHHRKFTGVEKETLRTYRVQRVLPSGETATFDSAVVEVSTKEFGPGSTTAMVGFSTPVPFIGRWINEANLFNLTIGVDPESPRRGQFIGLSILRSSGWVPQNFPVDLHLLAHARRIDRLKDSIACTAALTEVDCGTESRTYWGPAVALSFDASAVIAKAIEKLAN